MEAANETKKKEPWLSRLTRSIRNNILGFGSVGLIWYSAYGITGSAKMAVIATVAIWLVVSVAYLVKAMAEHPEEVARSREILLTKGIEAANKYLSDHEEEMFGSAGDKSGLVLGAIGVIMAAAYLYMRTAAAS